MWHTGRGHLWVGGIHTFPTACPNHWFLCNRTKCTLSFILSFTYFLPTSTLGVIYVVLGACTQMLMLPCATYNCSVFFCSPWALNGLEHYSMVTSKKALFRLSPMNLDRNKVCKSTFIIPYRVSLRSSAQSLAPIPRPRPSCENIFCLSWSALDIRVQV